MEIIKLHQKCTDCMLCVRDCAAAVWREVNGAAEVVSPTDCSLCSHCLAVCPTDAIIHKGLDVAQIQPLNTRLLNPEMYHVVSRGRRSIRNYKNKEISKQTLYNIIELSNYSPTASNSQNVSYMVITCKTTLNLIARQIFSFAENIYQFTCKFPGTMIYKFLQRFKWSETLKKYVEPMPYYIEQTRQGRDFILHNAPALILIHAPKKKSFSIENCNIAATNIMNYAYSLGLGTCYIGFLTLYLKFSQSLRKKLGIPPNRMVYAALIIGYPAYKHKNSVSRKKPDIKWINQP